MTQPHNIPAWWADATRTKCVDDLRALAVAVKRAGISPNDRIGVVRIWERMLRMRASSKPSEITNPTEITWTLEKYVRLKEMYNAAVSHHVEYITFDGHMLVVAYVKYLLEYLGGKLAEDVNGQSTG